MSERYSFSLTTFSPSGKLVQIEYAIAAVAAGAPSIGIKSKTGVVIAAEKKSKSILYDDTTVTKVDGCNYVVSIVLFISIHSVYHNTNYTIYIVYSIILSIHSVYHYTNYK